MLGLPAGMLGRLRGALHPARLSRSARSFGWLLLLGILPALGLLSCDDDSGPDDPGEPEPLVYGSLVTPRSDLDVDPYLVDAYQSLGVDGYQLGHFAVSWSAVERGPASHDWTRFERHVEQARRRSMGLSVVVEFVHGAEGDVPAWRWPEFPGWEDPDLLPALAGFIREMTRRSRGTIRYLWLGEGIDRFAARYPGDEPHIVQFYESLADSARAILPETRIGTMITPATLDATGGEPLVRDLLDRLDLIGLAIPAEPTAGAIPPPDVALGVLRLRIAAWEGSPFAVIDAGYPSGEDFASSPAIQSAFASTLAAWLRTRPATLELFCWSPIHDAGPALADSLAMRRFPLEDEARARMSALLRSSALRRLDGSPKVGRQVWVEERP